nr:hypothetical protein [Deinococcus maricopensis]
MQAEPRERVQQGAFGDAVREGSEPDVFLDGQVVVQGGVVGDVCEARAGGEGVRGVPVEGDVAGTFGQAGEGAQQRAFASAVRPAQVYEVAALHAKAEVVEDRVSVEGDVQVLSLEERAHGVRSACSGGADRNFAST